MSTCKQVFINLSAKDFNIYNNDLFYNLIGDYLLAYPETNWESLIEGEDLSKVFMEVLANNLTHVLDRNGLYHLLEKVYDFWRGQMRYLIADMSYSRSINEVNYQDIFNNFNRMILDSYRKMCCNLLGKNFKILRELPAGGNAFILLDKSKHVDYKELRSVRFIDSVIFRPPFVVYSKANKREGVFPIITKNPLEGININKKEWYCYPILVGKKRTFVYFKARYMSLALALSNLFEHDDEYKNHKPDNIILFGTNTVEGIYHDKEKDLYIASLTERDEIDYFGYMKKIILTVHNIEMINENSLPLHGACVSLTLKDHTTKNIVLIGDSGAGKSETLEALRKISNDYVLDMTTIFDDMGTLSLENGELKAYGTEIGAFVRTDDLENDYTYKVFDRAIFMNPSASNARIVIPISSYEDITKGINIDAIFYANNYTKKDKKIEIFDNKDSALEVFKKGERVAKGTTGEVGLVSTFFANPFGPVQLEAETNVLLDTYFDYFFNNNIQVGEIYTGLALEKGHLNPVYAAEELLKRLKGDN